MSMTELYARSGVIVNEFGEFVQVGADKGVGYANWFESHGYLWNGEYGTRSDGIAYDPSPAEILGWAYGYNYAFSARNTPQSVIAWIAVAAAAGGPLQPGEAGRYADLKRRGVPGDNLMPHHMPQKALRFTSEADGGALVLTDAEHAQARTSSGRGALTVQQDAGKPFRDVLAAEIRDVRSIAGNRYNRGLLDLINYYRTNFPDLIRK
jgi:hypothetical protein